MIEIGNGTANASFPAMEVAPPGQDEQADRPLAAKIVGTATEAALASDQFPMKRQAAGERPGTRSGMQARILLEGGTRIRVQVVVS